MLKGIRQENQNIKVIMVSAVGQEVIINEAMELGATAYIVKPFSEEKVLDTVRNVFSDASQQA